MSRLCQSTPQVPVLFASLDGQGPKAPNQRMLDQRRNDVLHALSEAGEQRGIEDRTCFVRHWISRGIEGDRRDGRVGGRASGDPNRSRAHRVVIDQEIHRIGRGAMCKFREQEVLEPDPRMDEFRLMPHQDQRSMVIEFAWRNIPISTGISTRLLQQLSPCGCPQLAERTPTDIAIGLLAQPDVLLQKRRLICHRRFKQRSAILARCSQTSVCNRADNLTHPTSPPHAESTCDGLSIPAASILRSKTSW